MLRIFASLLFASYVLVGRASADFIELPASHAVDLLPPSAAGGALSDLQHESGYLEVGYYAVDGRASSLRRARPEAAGPDATLASSFSAYPLGLDPKWAPVSLASFLLALGAFLTRKRRSPRV